MDCSTRSFRSLFESYIGLSPKLFCQIIRYQSAVGRLLHPSRAAFNDIISEYGYYDQAHFIHEFKKFSSECPTRWMVQLLRKS
jgi:AraC-like DNA-binding protein